MLASRHRLTAPSQFQETVRRGRRCGGPLLVVHLLVRPAVADQPRAGFVVSRSVGPAVVRNLVKRRLRHLVRDLLDELPEGSLLVIRAQPRAAHASYAELREELQRCLARCLDRDATAVAVR